VAASTSLEWNVGGDYAPYWRALSAACRALSEARIEAALAVLAQVGLTPPAFDRTAQDASLVLLEHVTVSLRAMAPVHVLQVSGDARTFRMGAHHVDLSKRPTLRNILHALIDAKGRVSTEALVAAGWPGEHISRHAGQCRVRAAVATLRRSGLASVIHRDRDGYFLNADVELRIG
jgi:hypothetical protein